MLALAPLVAVPLVLAVTAAAPRAEAHVGKRQGLTFQDVRPLKLTWEYGKNTASLPTVGMCNLDLEEATNVDDALVGLDFKHGDQALTEVFKDPGAPTTLGPGKCAQLIVAVDPDRTDPQRPDGGTYVGMLVVTSGGSGGARRRLIVTVQPRKEKLKANGLGDPVSFNATRNGPGGDVHLNDNEKLPLKAEKGKRLVLPEDGDLLGTVVKGTDVASVYVDGEPVRRPAKGFVFVPISIQGIAHTGDYAGTLNLATEGAAQEVKISVRVADGVGWAAGAVGLGALLALGGQLLLRRWRVKWNLHKRLDGLAKKYEAAETALHRNPGGYTDIKAPAGDDLKSYVDEVKDVIKVDMDSSLFFDTGSDAYKSIIKSIARAEADADFIKSKDGLRKHLDGLGKALEQLVELDRPAAFAAAAQSLRRGGSLKVGEATARAKTADEYAALAPRFNALASEVKTLARLAAALRANAKAAPTDWQQFESEALLEADAQVGEAKAELLAATDAKDLERASTADELASARGVLEALRVRHEVTVSTRELRAEARAAGVSMDVVGEVIARAAHAGGLSKTLGWIADVAVFALMIATSLVTALTAFYFGQAWGSTADYLTAIFAGTGVALIVKGADDTFTKMSVGTRTATVLAEGEEAVAKPDSGAAVAAALEAAESVA